MIVTDPENAALLSSALLVFAHLGLSGDKLVNVGRLQYLLHTLYAAVEPTILRITDFILTRRFLTGTRTGRLLLRFFASLCRFIPHGIVLTTDTAKKLVSWIDEVGTPQGPVIAVGPCVCQSALNKWSYPVHKDIVILYGADIYTHISAGYRLINAEQASAILQECSQAGLVHILDFCMQSGRWAFAICSCDREICVLTRTHRATNCFVYAGPQTVHVEPSLCPGADKCGLCVGVCHFDAISTSSDGQVAQNRPCMGCGLCASVCASGARTMVTRAGFAHRDKVPAVILAPTPTRPQPF